jgi:hypothetical protein
LALVSVARSRAQCPHDRGAIRRRYRLPMSRITGHERPTYGMRFPYTAEYQRNVRGGVEKNLSTLPVANRTASIMHSTMSVYGRTLHADVVAIWVLEREFLHPIIGDHWRVRSRLRCLKYAYAVDVLAVEEPRGVRVCRNARRLWSSCLPPPTLLPYARNGFTLIKSVISLLIRAPILSGIRDACIDSRRRRW